jgi:acid phosphatase
MLVCGLAAACTSAPSAHQAPTSLPASSSAPSASAATPASPSPGGHRPDHVVVVVFENKGYDQIHGSSQAPWLNSMAAGGAAFSNARAETHPSQPNYLALFSGSTQGVRDDHCPVDLTGKPNLGQQLIGAGYTFTGYSEGLPSPGYLGCSHDGYAAKHNPWVDFNNVPASANQPYSAFPTDYSALPTLSFVIPNLCNDMHDCSIRTGDDWARTHLDGYLQWAKQHNSLLVVTFDEDNGTAANHIFTAIVGGGVAPGSHPEPITHYSLLRFFEDLYGLPPLGKAASATPITGIWR